MSNYKSIIAILDRYVFIKNGYSFCKHLIPFSVAALLFLVMSLPNDDLLLKLVNVLKKPSWIWVPAGLLTMVSFVIYTVSINVQVRQAYLWSDRDLCRTITTSFIFIILCSLMGYGVLRSDSSQTMTWSAVWACILIAVLSLTGIGWSRSDSWVESIGIKSPDYTKGRLSAKKLMDIINSLREKPYGEKRDIEDFLCAAKSLLLEIEENLDFEPEWARSDLKIVRDKIRTLIEETKAKFPTNNKSAVEIFPAVCSYEQESQYPEFVNAIRVLSKYWYK